MGDEEIIRMVREEHEKLAQNTIALKEVLSRPSKPDASTWLEDLCKHFEAFRAHLIRRIALEEIGGFLAVVIERKPTLSPQVDHLKARHQKMIEMAGITMARLREFSPDDRESLNQAAVLVKMMLAEVKHHEEAESVLVSFVFAEDIGVGD
jgi:hypothetical protein